MDRTMLFIRLAMIVGTVVFGVMIVRNLTGSMTGHPPAPMVAAER